MSIVLTDSVNYTNIANAIREKGVNGTFKPSQMAQAITSIPAGGNVFWLTGENAVKVMDDTTTPLTFNDLGIGTTIIPTTSAKTLIAKNTWFNRKFDVPQDVQEANDYVALSTNIVKYVYKDDADLTNIPHSQWCAYQSVIWWWKNPSNNAQGWTYANAVTNKSLLHYKTKTGTPYMYSGAYGITINATTTGISKNQLSFANNSINIQANNTYMPVSAFDLLDLDKSIMYNTFELYKVDNDTILFRQMTRDIMDKLGVE